MNRGWLKGEWPNAMNDFGWHWQLRCQCFIRRRLKKALAVEPPVPPKTLNLG